MKSSPDKLTSESRFFLEPTSAAQRQYEALRAYFVEGLSSADVAARFAYSPGSFRVFCHHFRRSKPHFFRELKHGPHTQPKKDAVRELILGMRKLNLSIYDIESALKTQQTPLSTTAIWEILHEAGFARLPRRQDEERPATLLPTTAAVADCREFSLSPRRFTTQLGGLFLFLPLLRSEEHTSELQSLRHLVCRLLLEKKKQTRLSRGRTFFSLSSLFVTVTLSLS